MSTVSLDGVLLETETSELRLEGGRYTLVGRLGSGGMAQVYLARDGRLGVWRAIKVLSSRRSTNVLALQRFEREARVMALLDHPAIARVYDLDHHGDRPYIVLELVTGGSLWDWIERHRRPLPARDAVLACRSICGALAAAHERGVIHRDVKPNNVLIAEGGSCKLTDFGVALLEGGAREQRGARLGTEGYHPPEQRVDAGRVDERADLYGVGATLYTLVTGRRPRDLDTADHDAGVLRMLPRPLRPVVRRACAWRPSDRPRDALALLAELDAVLLDLGPRPEEAPPLYEPMVSLPGLGAMPTAPTGLARVRRRPVATEPMPAPRVAVAPPVTPPEEGTLSRGWAEDPQLVASAGFAVGAGVIGLVGAAVVAAAMYLG